VTECAKPQIYPRVRNQRQKGKTGDGTDKEKTERAKEGQIVDMERRRKKVNLSER